MPDAACTVVIFGGETDPGYRLAQRVIAAGGSAVAVIRQIRDPSHLKRLGAELLWADVTDRAAVDGVFAALSGQGRRGDELAVVCIIGGTSQLNTQGNINVIDAAVAAGVRRLVLTSSIGCGDSAAILDPFLQAVAGRGIRAKEWAENHLRGSGLDWTIVRAGGTVRRAGLHGAMLTDSTVVTGYISLHDLGDMLYEALASPRAIHRALAAVDQERAYNIDGAPLRPAEL